MEKPAEKVYEIVFGGVTYHVETAKNGEHQPTWVRDDEGDDVFMLPWCPSEAQITSLIHIYFQAKRRGEAAGRSRLQFELRQLLDVVATDHVIGMDIRLDAATR